MEFGRDRVADYFRDREGHVPKDEPRGGRSKAIPVAYTWEDRVRLKGGELFAGFVTGVIARPSGVLYEVSWPDNRTTTQHFDFELEPVE